MPTQLANMVLVYLGFVLLALVLTLARRWIRPTAAPSNTWRKIPTYLLMNVVFLTAIALPLRWHALVALLAVLGAAASWELGGALALPATARVPLTLSTAALVLASGWLDARVFACVWLGALLGGAALVAVRARERRNAHLAGVAACVGYLPLCLAAFVWVRESDYGALAAILLYGVVACSDAYAQITGQLVGTRPLVPRISPAKTLEGAIGGVAAGALFASAMCAAAGYDPLRGGLVGAIVAIAGLGGDLLASSWKRRLGLKDFSSALGVHGGVLDRFDSLLQASPVFLLLMTLRPTTGFLVIPPWLGMLGVLGTLVGVLGAVRWWQVRYEPAPEIPRKLVHVAMGLVALCLPWVFSEAWPVLLLGLVATCSLLAIRLNRTLCGGVGGVLHSVERRSLGDIAFPVGVAIVFWLAHGDKVAYLVPVLMLALADPAACIVGVRFGATPLAITTEPKTLEGSVAFFTAAFACGLTVLLLGTAMRPADILLFSASLALLASTIEAVSWRGLDNLFIPIGTFAFLELCRAMQLAEMAAWSVTSLLLVAVWITWRRRRRAAASRQPSSETPEKSLKPRIGELAASHSEQG